MSDSVRSLVVSLYLNSGKFDDAIKLVNKEIKAAENEFKMAGAATEGYEKTLEGAYDKARMLEKVAKKHAENVGYLVQKLDKLSDVQQAQGKQYEETTDKLKDATEKLKDYGDAVDRTKAAIEQAKAEDDTAKADTLTNRLKEQKNEYKEQAREVKRLTAEKRKLEKQLSTTQYKIADTTSSLYKERAELKETEKELQKQREALYRVGEALEGWAEKREDAAQKVSKLGSKLTKWITTPIVTAGTAAAKAGINFEDAFANVRKTVDATGEDSETFFNSLSDAVLDMSKRLATSATDIAEIMSIAGQLGIHNDELEEFTEIVTRLGMSTDLSGEEAASAMAKFANVTGMSQNEFSNMGATLVDLGNHFATTESDIMAMATKISAAGSQVGLTESEILGFATALSSLGLEADAGGSAFSKALRKMETAVATGSEALDDFARVAGVTNEEFAQMWTNDPSEAFQAFIVGLSNMNDEGIGAIATLDEIGITELRLSDTLLRTANASDLVGEALERANTAWQENTALTIESDTRLETTASRLTNLKNSLIAVGVEFADALAPVIESLIGKAEDVIEWLDNLDEGVKKGIVSWGLYAAAIPLVIKTVGVLSTGVTGTVKVIGKLSKQLALAKISFTSTGNVASALATFLGPGGLLVAAVAAATAAIAGLLVLFNRVKEEKPDFSIDKSEIDSYKIEPVSLDADVDVDTDVNVSGEILNLKKKFIDILNDGVPETEEIRQGMKDDIAAAVQEVYDMIDEQFNPDKAALDEQYEAGLIDEETYNTALAQLTNQADTLKQDLTTKADAVTTYVATLCANNRAMTNEEIETLNSLLESLGATADAVTKVSDAQMSIYELSYKKVLAGYGDETDIERAQVYIESVADEKIAELKTEREAVEKIFAATTADTDETEQNAQLEKLQETTDAFDAQTEAIEKNRIAQHGELNLALLEQYGITQEDMENYKEAVALLQELYRINPEDGLDWRERTGAWWGSIFDISGNSAQDAIDTIDAIVNKLDESDLMGEDSPILKSLATLTETGVVSEEDLTNTYALVDALAQLVTQTEPAAEAMEQAGSEVKKESKNIMPGAAEGVKSGAKDFLNAMTGTADGGAMVFAKAFDMHSPSRVMYDQGLNIMYGLRNGINSGRNAVLDAMRQAARAAVTAAKEELDINSPSKVFENEVGAMAMKGFGKGITEEARRQASIIGNATKYMTGAAATGGKTYNSESNVTVTGNTFVLNDKQDVQSLASEIASLTRTNQRGRGVRGA